VTGLLHGMTPLSWVLLCLLLAGVLGVLGLIVAGARDAIRGRRAAEEHRAAEDALRYAPWTSPDDGGAL
jgi:hypothetical protein